MNNNLRNSTLIARMIELCSGGNNKHIKPWKRSISYEMGWTSIPNCESFNLIVKEWDPRWKSIGIKKRYKPTIQFTKGNHKMNKYMNYQVKRLEKHKWDSFKYFKLADKLLKYSKVFRISAWRKIKKGWYYELDLKYVKYVNNKVSLIFKNRLSGLSIRRVYIPKKDTYRPLGVPSLEWRIALHMINNIMYQYLRNAYLPSQHGFLRGRGTLTAWIQLFKDILPLKYIYECDLKQFFPSIQHRKIILNLMMNGVPETWMRWIDAINCATPILPKKELLDETDTRSKVVAVNSFYGSKQIFKHRNFNTKIGLGACWGVPQGSPLSPLISILGLTTFLSQKFSISYADDPIFGDNEDFEIHGEEYEGIILHPDKSGWIRRGGTWLKPIKYLGLVYDAEKNILYKKSKKNGEDLIFLDEARVRTLLNSHRVRNKHLTKFEIWNALGEHGLLGKLMSVLYENSWNRPIHKENVRMNHFRSWLTVNMKRNEANVTDSTQASIWMYDFFNNKRKIPIRKIIPGWKSLAYYSDSQ